MNTQYIIPKPGMVITEDVSFLPGVYNFFENEGIIIAGNDITINGNGAVFIGGKMKTESKDDTNKNEFSYGYSKSRKDNSLGYNGIAFYSKDTKNVTIKNITVKNFEIGLKIEKCTGWNIEENDFSYNYHNPDHGWEEHEDLGGIVLYYSDHCKIENNKANNVWNALTIRYSDRNIIKNNNFSHTSNVGLRLWLSCKNEFYNNDFSWGIRKEPYEVHARDSSSVLIETGSNDNIFIKNDMRFGGDGLFIRSLNGWMSSGNYFEENDTSFANNNAIEAWDEGNTYVRNKANFSSYGFWLGNSDNTVLIENEVSYNGVNYKNAPENFGNAGIAVVNGSGTNFKMIRNKIHCNNGPGVAIRNRIDYPSNNWIIEENEIFDNKTDTKGFVGHGIYLKYARGINLINNKIYNNDGENIYMDEFVGDVQEFNRKGKPKDIAVKIKVDAKSFIVDELYTFEASVDIKSEKLEFKWDFGNSEVYNTKTVEKKFEKPGFYRAIVSVNDGENVNFDYINIYVLAEGLELGTDSELSNWVLTADKGTKLSINEIEYVSGSNSLLLESEKGKDITLRYPKNKGLKIDASKYTHFSFCLRFLNENIDWYKENKIPTIRFYKDRDNYIEFIPKPNLFADLANKYNESKYKWAYMELDLNNDNDYNKKINGEFDFKEVNYIELYLDSKMESHFIFMFDGMKFIEKRKECYANIVDISKHLNDINLTQKVKASSENIKSNVLAPLTKKLYFGDVTDRWISSDKDGEEFYEIDLGTTRQFDRVVVDFYYGTSKTLHSNNEKLPEELTVEYFAFNKWHEIEEGTLKIIDSHNVISFNTVLGNKIRFTIKGMEKPFAIYNIEVNNTLNKLTRDKVSEIKAQNKANIDIEKVGVKLNCDLNEKGSKLSHLMLSVHEYDDDILKSKTLFEKEYKINEIHFKKETIFDINLEKLDTSKNYYLAMTQKNLAEDLTTGQYYRWAGSGISDMDGTYGYVNGSELVTDKVGWGRNWLKIYTDKYILDLSHTNDSLGNRFGIKKMEKIYQKFELNSPITNLMDNSISDFCALSIIDKENISFLLKEEIKANKIVLYFKDNATAKVEVSSFIETYTGKIVDNICEITINRILKEFDISIMGEAILKAVEIL